jgi:mannonate dehydratase
MRGESIAQAAPNDGPPTQEILDARWSQVCKFYERMIPIAEEYNVNLAMHPSDTPLGDTLFGGLGLHRLIDAFPSPNVGYLYCCGTRAEAGGSPLVLDEINHYGRKGRLFEIHFRNERGSLPTAGGFEEVLLDDGDMNMFKILQALHHVGFDGYLNPDHVPTLEGNDAYNGQGLSYSVGYIKALLAALAAS